MQNQNLEQLPSTASEERHSKRSIKIWLLVLVPIAVVVGGYFAYTSITPKREHLIMGVPYWGLYRGSEISTSGAFAVYSTLQYWGDQRFSRSDIVRLFQANTGASREPDDLPSFFASNGYHVETPSINDLSELYPYLDADIPVIMALRASPDADPRTSSLRVVIGYSEKDRTLTVHDNLFGNNYKWSFDDVKEMVQDQPTNRIIAVRPTDELLPFIDGPNHDQTYPDRMSIMDSKDMQDIWVKWATVQALRKQYFIDGTTTSPQMVALWEEILANDSFSQLPPDLRLYASFDLARLYTNNLKKHQQAIDLLNSTVFPLLTTDFNPKEGWDKFDPQIYRSNIFWKTKPLVLLGIVYVRMGNTSEAKEVLEGVLKENPSDQEALRYLDRL